MTTYMPLLCQLLALLAAFNTVAAQTTTAAAAQAPVPITNSAGAPVGGDLSLDNFEYQHGNTAGLVSVLNNSLQCICVSYRKTCKRP